VAVSVYPEGGVTKLATIKPTTLIDLYAAPGLGDAAREVKATPEAIMDEEART